MKSLKTINREYRKIANLPSNLNYYKYFILVGISTKPCSCCRKLEKRKHTCTHEFCNTNCTKKKMEMAQNNVHVKVNHPVKRLVLSSSAMAAAKQKEIHNMIMNRRQKEYEAKLLTKLKEKSKNNE